MTYTNAADLPPRRRALGISRRLRALAWMGHDPSVVAIRYGLPVLLARTLTVDGVGDARYLYTNDADVPPDVWHAAAVAFEDLSMTFGPSDHFRNMARRNLWRPPLAWDDDVFEDPQRAGGAGTPPKTRRFDEVVVVRRINGDHDVPMRPEDTEEAVRRLHARGLSDPVIADLLGVWGRSVGRARKRLGLAPNEDLGPESRANGLYLNRAGEHRRDNAA